MRIRISFPEDRDYAGRLEVLDAEGAIVLGPFPAAGRAHDQSAAQHGNPLRDPILPYGDTPVGGYAVRGVFETIPFGAHAAVLLEPVSGEAALADAQGRFRFFIQAGAGDAGLCATAGAVRLLDRDQEQLVALMRRTTERVLCEIVTTAERGAKLLPAPAPLDADPPLLPERPRVATQSPQFRPAATRAIRSAPRFFVVAERSGSGGTGYGGGGEGGGSGSTDAGDGSGGASLGSGDGGVSGGGAPPIVTDAPDQAIVTDASPVTGVDLAPQQPVVTDDASGVSKLLSTASQTGLSNPYGQAETGWLSSPLPVDSYTGGAIPGGSLTNYVGSDAGTYTGTSEDTGVANSYTGTPNPYPYADSPNASSTPVDASLTATYNGPFEPDMGVHEATQAELDAMVARFAQYDAQLAAGQADPNAGTLPSLAPAFASGALGSGSYLPGFERQGVPTFSQPLGRGPQVNKWKGNITESSFQGSSLLGGALLQDLNNIPYVTARGGPGNPGFFPVVDYQNYLTRNPTSIASSTRGNVNNPGDPARLDFYLNKYQKLVGSVEPGKLDVAARNLGLTPNDIATRGSLAINADDVPAFRSYLAQDIRTNPGDYPAGWNPTKAANQIVSHNLTTPELVNLGRARGALGNLPPSDVRRLTTPEGLLVSRTGSYSGALDESGFRGGAYGAALSTAIQLGQLAFDDQQHSALDYATAGGRTALAGGASGVTGGTVETAVGARLSQTLLQSAASGGEVGVLTPLLGRVAGGALGGGVGAGVFQVGSLALDDQQHSAVDYEAKGTRAAVAGALSGALAAGATFAVAGSVAPGVGTAIGFVVGAIGYLLIDYDFGDDIEGEVRSLDDPAVPDDPGGFFPPDSAASEFLGDPFF